MLARTYQSMCNYSLEEMQKSKKNMIKEGIWTDQTTLEEWLEYGKRNISLEEKKE